MIVINKMYAITSSGIILLSRGLCWVTNDKVMSLQSFLFWFLGYFYFLSFPINSFPSVHLDCPYIHHLPSTYSLICTLNTHSTPAYTFLWTHSSLPAEGSPPRMWGQCGVAGFAWRIVQWLCLSWHSRQPGPGLPGLTPILFFPTLSEYTKLQHQRMLTL